MIYIGGYGRSGSTIAELVIADQFGCFAAGELTHLFSWAREGRPCACGVPVAKCDFWVPILATVEAEVGLRVAEETNARVEATFRPTAGDLRRYSAVWSATIAAIVRSGPFAGVIDSSKSSGGRTRGYEIARVIRTLGQPFTFVHLTRDPRAVLYSAARGRNSDLERSLVQRRNGWRAAARAGFGWVRANVLAQVIRGRLGSAGSMVVRYEDLCSSPQAALGRLAVRADIEAERPIRKSDMRHGIAGNRLRRSSASSSALVEDTAWRTHMSTPMALASSILLPVRWLTERWDSS